MRRDGHPLTRYTLSSLQFLVDVCFLRIMEGSRGKKLVARCSSTVVEIHSEKLKFVG